MNTPIHQAWKDRQKAWQAWAQNDLGALESAPTDPAEAPDSSHFSPADFSLESGQVRLLAGAPHTHPLPYILLLSAEDLGLSPDDREGDIPDSHLWVVPCSPYSIPALDGEWDTQWDSEGLRVLSFLWARPVPPGVLLGTSWLVTELPVEALAEIRAAFAEYHSLDARSDPSRWGWPRDDQDARSLEHRYLEAGARYWDRLIFTRAAALTDAQEQWAQASQGVQLPLAAGGNEIVTPPAAQRAGAQRCLCHPHRGPPQAGHRRPRTGGL